MKNFGSINPCRIKRNQKNDFVAKYSILHGLSLFWVTHWRTQEKEAEFLYRRILNEKLLDCTTPSASPALEAHSENLDIEKVDIHSISNEDSRSFGGEWLSKQMLDSCGLPHFLSQSIDNEDIEELISVEIISRMIHPSSELETSRRIENESSLCEILSLHKIFQFKHKLQICRVMCNFQSFSRLSRPHSRPLAHNVVAASRRRGFHKGLGGR